MVRNQPTVRETQVQFLGWKDGLEKRMSTHSGIMPGKFRGQRSLAGCGQAGREAWHAAVHGVAKSWTPFGD